LLGHIVLRRDLFETDGKLPWDQGVDSSQPPAVLDLQLRVCESSSYRLSYQYPPGPGAARRYSPLYPFNLATAQKHPQFTVPTRPSCVRSATLVIQCCYKSTETLPVDRPGRDSSSHILTRSSIAPSSNYPRHKRHRVTCSPQKITPPPPPGYKVGGPAGI